MEPFLLKITAQEARFYTPEGDGVPLVKKFWGEQQAGLNVYRNYPLFGVGSGSYQEAIATGYDTLGDIDKQRLEPDAQNGYILTLVSNGLLGLAALLVLLGGYVRMARARVRWKRGDPWAAAQLGALVAVIFAALRHQYLGARHLARLCGLDGHDRELCNSSPGGAYYRDGEYRDHRVRCFE